MFNIVARFSAIVFKWNVMIIQKKKKKKNGFSLISLFMAHKLSNRFFPSTLVQRVDHVDDEKLQIFTQWLTSLLYTLRVYIQLSSMMMMKKVNDAALPKSKIAGTKTNHFKTTILSDITYNESGLGDGFQ